MGSGPFSATSTFGAVVGPRLVGPNYGPVLGDLIDLGLLGQEGFEGLSGDPFSRVGVALEGLESATENFGSGSGCE